MSGLFDELPAVLNYREDAPVRVEMTQHLDEIIVNLSEVHVATFKFSDYVDWEIDELNDGCQPCPIQR